MREQDLRQIFEDHKDAVYDFALRMTGSAALAEDVAQDCFVELLRHPAGFDEKRGSLRTFLFGMTRNLVHRRWRADRRLVRIDDDWRESSLQSYTPDLSDGITSRVIREAVQSLPVLQREAILLFEYEGLTLDEIARIADLDVGTVKSRLHRARQALRQLLAPLRSDCGVRK
jgi:RNA polymerase sigma-70 factor (ECF subfamily)